MHSKYLNELLSATRFCLKKDGLPKRIACHLLKKTDKIQKLNKNNKKKAYQPLNAKHDIKKNSSNQNTSVPGKPLIHKMYEMTYRANSLFPYAIPEIYEIFRVRYNLVISSTNQKPKLVLIACAKKKYTQ